jgi:hypothetical protein
MNEFVRFDPFIHANPEIEVIQSLRSWNTLLKICLVIAISVAAYYAYQCYLLNDRENYSK